MYGHMMYGHKMYGHNVYEVYKMYEVPPEM